MSNRWSRNQNIGDCKTCLCRISPQRPKAEALTSTSTVSTDEDGTAPPPKNELSDSQMSSQLLASLRSMLDDESLCDVKLRVGNSSAIVMSAHKIVLAAASPYFRKMFSSRFKEAQDGQVNFHDIQPEVLRAVIYFIYTGKIQIDELIVDGLLDAADLLQLPSLRNLCIWWLTTNLSPSSCLSVYILAQLRLHLDLAETAKHYAIDHFKEVIECEEFLHISPEVFQAFLDAPYLGCDNNGHLLKALIEWTAHDEAKRRPWLLAFMDKINLEEVVPQILIEVIQHPIIINGESNLEKMLRDSLTNVLSSKFDSLDPADAEQRLIHLQSQQSRCFYQQDVILAIGGESQGQSLSNVECFMLGYDGWKCSIPLPSSPAEQFAEMAVIPTMKQCRFYPAVANDTYSVYVLGGQDCGFPVNIVEKYSVLHNEWETLSPLPVAVHGCGAAFVNSKLYVVGGRSSQKHENRVWVYDQKTDSWSETTPMKYHRSHVAVCSSIGELYAIGGIGGLKETDDNFLQSVEKFDPITNTWTELAPMHEERAFHSAAVVDCLIYSMGGCSGKMWLRTVEKFDPMSGIWCKVSNMSIARSSFGTTVTSGRIYCVGGYDGVHFLNTAEKYNPRTDRWHCVHAMQIERYGLVVATLPVPLKTHVAGADYS